MIRQAGYRRPWKENKMEGKNMLETKANAIGKRLLTVTVMIGTLICLSFAQQDLGKGRISGIVVDESGAPVGEALVVAQSLRSETKLEGRSDSKGRFAIAGLGTGNWRLTATKA